MALRLLLYLLAVVCCEAGRITRGLEHDLFPNFRTVYHGHGATSYQNVDIENHGSVPIPIHSKHVHHAVHHQPIYEEKDNHIDSVEIVEIQPQQILQHYVLSKTAPYIDDHLEHITIEEAISPQYYHHYGHEDYEYD